MRARLCAVLVVAACGSGASSGDDDTQPDGSIGTPDGATEAGWETLIARSWTLGPSGTGYKCFSKKIEQDTYVSALRAVSPLGTHHEILSMSATPFPMTGAYDCGDGDGGMQLLYAGGIGTQDLLMPTGVAIKLAAGTYINLNVHVANYSDATVTQTSGIEVKTLPASDVVHEADMLFVGRYDFSIPPTSQPSVVIAGCNAAPQGGWNIVSAWPHMHSYGTRSHVYIKRNGGFVTDELLNVPYSYEEQKHYPMTAKLDVNDMLYAECIYVNNTNITYPPGFAIEYGESPTAEMCFTGFIKYPAGGNKNLCVE